MIHYNSAYQNIFVFTFSWNMNEIYSNLVLFRRNLYREGFNIFMNLSFEGLCTFIVFPEGPFNCGIKKRKSKCRNQQKLIPKASPSREGRNSLHTKCWNFNEILRLSQEFYELHSLVVKFSCFFREEFLIKRILRSEKRSKSLRSKFFHTVAPLDKVSIMNLHPSALFAHSMKVFNLCLFVFTIFICRSVARRKETRDELGVIW